MKKFLCPFLVFVALLFVSGCSEKANETTAQIHVLFLAGENSHGWGSHKHIAGSMLLSDALPKGTPGVSSEMARGWPNGEQLENADVLVIYADGWGKHPANEHLEELKAFMDTGKGLIALHWATGIGLSPQAAVEQNENQNRIADVSHEDDPNHAAWRQLMGADFEAFYSISNHYTAEFNEPADHPIMNGVGSFHLFDECYYHLRDTGSIDRLLTLHPPVSTIQDGLTPYRGNDYARESLAQKREQYTAWAFERPEGGRAFGFTGGHYHWSWARDEVRKMVMNACLWAAGVEVPKNGVDTPRPNAGQMLANMDVVNPGWTEDALQVALDLAQEGTPIPWGRHNGGPLNYEPAVSLFDGQSLSGWQVREGEEKWWRVTDGVIEGGSFEEKVPHNTFITLPKSYQNFELKLKVRVIAGEGEGFKNSGIQVRSQRLPDHHEMIGYQVDAGIGWWGKIYDESRRRMVIAEPLDEAALKAVVHDWDEWNEYRILAEGPRIRTWINGVFAHDYTEEDSNMPLEGLIGVQAHSGGKFVVQFKDLSIRELPPTEGAKTWEGVELKAWPKKQ